jgi:myosin heavy subunit
MCINVTNEQLQQYFNHFIFVAEQAEYERENIDFSRVLYVDNQATLDLFLKRPGGVFALLDEESRFPKGTDLTFVDKCAALKTHESKAFLPARAEKDLYFTITHYAGEVVYRINSFLEKNRDLLSQDVVSVMQNSLDPLIAAIFPPGDTGNNNGLCGWALVSVSFLGETVGVTDLSFPF